MRSLGLMLALLGALGLAACQSGTPSGSPSGTPSGSPSGTPSITPSNGSKGPTASPLAGTWELDILSDSQPHIVIAVAGDLRATLVSSAGFANQQYANIKFIETPEGINVVFDQIQSCGNRIITYTTKKYGDEYSGFVSAPNPNCAAGSFTSPDGDIKLVRQK